MRTYDLGVNAYVVKPVDFHEFVDAVKLLGGFWAVVNEPPPEAARVPERARRSSISRTTGTTPTWSTRRWPPTGIVAEIVRVDTATGVRGGAGVGPVRRDPRRLQPAGVRRSGGAGDGRAMRARHAVHLPVRQHRRRARGRAAEGRRHRLRAQGSDGAAAVGGSPRARRSGRARASAAAPRRTCAASTPSSSGASSSGRMELAESQRRLQAILDYSPADDLAEGHRRAATSSTNREFESARRRQRDAISAGSTIDDLFAPRLADGLSRPTTQQVLRAAARSRVRGDLPARRTGRTSITRSSSRCSTPTARPYALCAICHRRHRAQEDRRCAADRAARGRARQPREERVPVEHEPRSADAAQRDPRLRAAARARRSARRSEGERRADPARRRRTCCR